MSMDMASTASSMAMDMTATAASSSMDMMASPTVTAAAASSSAAAMDMGMGMGGACKISMLWNWYTVDSCFLSSTWRITSDGMFAGSCIGVILLVIALEGLRRGAQEYDRFIVRSHPANNNSSRTAGVAEGYSDLNKNSTTATTTTAPASSGPRAIRPNVLQQAIRAGLHMLQFAVAYFIMLLAMYFNGYIIISIFIGAYIGSFVFGWQTLGMAGGEEREITYCCG
ncbi:hypothetical protein LTR22_009236 [Elasticomyces elasticus]|nr:hypothetical protein LTR22_009236 [Elasticomyces elasticus]KAK4922490.1 hypothetical protein LTR49_010190 [Elasticomyces elasticus]KAK5760577.1 hypothetical protein LTS12_009286 [Elasticomyces elasticus]